MRRAVVLVIALALVALSGLTGWQLESGSSVQAAESMQIPFNYQLIYKHAPNPTIGAKCDAWKAGTDGTYSQIVVKSRSNTIIGVFDLSKGNLPGDWVQSMDTGVWACQATFYVSVPVKTYVTLYLNDERITTINTSEAYDFTGTAIQIPSDVMG